MDFSIFLTSDIFSSRASMRGPFEYADVFQQIRVEAKTYLLPHCISYDYSTEAGSLGPIHLSSLGWFSPSIDFTVDRPICS